MKDLADGDARQRIRTQLDRSMLVEAAAGTGKTTELVERVLGVLREGRGSVESLVAVTFTEKAAGELKLRLRARLEGARQTAATGTPERARLESALTRLEEARVSTIHGFCADLLRERPVEARVDPQFRVMTEAEARQVFRAAYAGWLQTTLENPGEGVRRALRRSAFALRQAQGEGGPGRRLELAAWMLAEWRDFTTPWRRDVFPRDREIDALAERACEFADLTSRCSSPSSDLFYRDTDAARRFCLTIRAAEAVRPRDYDGLEAAFADLAGGGNFRRARSGRGKWFAPGVAREDVLEAHRLLRAALEDFARKADADLAPLLQGELFQVVRLYDELKRRSGRLDFLDLLLRARDLVRDCDDVRADFQRRFTHVFVDEFQDTDPLQAEILLLLAADDASARDWRATRPVPGKLFLVGDPKQSIYRFRRADVGVYLAVKDLLARSGAACEQLRTSFRAVPSLQKVINAGFAAAMTEDAVALQAGYVSLAPSRDEPPGQPSVVALPVPRPLGWNNEVTQKAIESSLPDATGAFVQWLLGESGWTVTDRERRGERVPVSARHVCLLFRRFEDQFKGDMTRPYVEALEARGIPHLIVGGGSYHGREEVETMRTALAAIEWPEDELSVFATLRGPLFATTDEDLFEYRHTFKHLNPYRVPPDLPPHLALVGEALAVLRDLHRGRNRRTVAETISLLLETTRAHASLVLRPSGEQVLANVLHLTEIARSYESTGGLSFRGFVRQLLDEAEDGRAAEAPILEEGSDGVRLMTVHKSKGLEFPVVILADMTCRLVRPSAGRHIDPERGLCAVRLAGWSPAELIDREPEEVARDRAEAVRVAYVAATRARDLLVVPAIAQSPYREGWLSPLNAALYPPVQGEVMPALFEFDEGHKVLWFDHARLRLDAQPFFGIRQEQLIGRDAPPDIVEADRRRHDEWAAARASTLASGATPSVAVATVTARAAAIPGRAAAIPGRAGGPPASDAVLPSHVPGDPEPRADVEVIELPCAADRPGGPRFGALVHAILADAAWEDPASVDTLAEMHARLIGADDQERRAAAEAVRTALAHPLMVRARRASEQRRETPVTLRDTDGTILDGVVDLAFFDDGRWTVIDFKTDRELARDRDLYKRQVALYCRAVSAATGQPATGVLLRV